MYFVCDIGGTKIKTGISWDGVSVVQPNTIDTSGDFETDMANIGKIIGDYKKEQPISKAGIGVAGVLDAKKTKITKSPNLTDWEGKSLKKILEKYTGCQVIIENDAVMGGIGEARFGAGRRTSIVGYLTFGTGIGGCKLVDGIVEKRNYGFEPGNMILAWGEKVGYLDEYASGAAMENIYHKPAEEIEDPEIWKNETRLLAIAVHNATVLWSPELIVLGGSLMKKVDLDLLVSLCKEQNSRYEKIPKITVSELGEKAGLMGALYQVSGQE